jgi:hypothetical protein
MTNLIRQHGRCANQVLTEDRMVTHGFRPVAVELTLRRAPAGHPETDTDPTWSLRPGRERLVTCRQVVVGNGDQVIVHGHGDSFALTLLNGKSSVGAIGGNQ